MGGRRVARQASDASRQRLGIADGQHLAGPGLGQHARDLGLGRADVQRWPTTGHDAEQLGGHDDAGELLALADEVDIAEAEEVFEFLAWLVVFFEDVAQAVLADKCADLVPPLAAADEDENDVLAVAQQPGGVVERGRLVSHAEIARVHDHELAFEPPGGAVGRGRCRFVLGERSADRPDADHLDRVRVDALAYQSVAHAPADHDDTVRPAEAGTVEPGHHPSGRRSAPHDARGGEHVRIKVHGPVDIPAVAPPTAVQPAGQHPDEADVGRAGQRDDKLRAASGQAHAPRLPRRRDVKDQRIENARQQRPGPEPRDAHPVDLHAVTPLPPGQGGPGLTVERAGGDDRDLVAVVGKLPGHVFEKLRRRRDVGGIGLVDEKDSHGR